jgi:hypothetical protein
MLDTNHSKVSSPHIRCPVSRCLEGANTLRMSVRDPKVVFEAGSLFDYLSPERPPYMR